MFRVVLMTLMLAVLHLFWTATAAAQSTLTFTQALALAQQQAPGGQLVKSRMEKGGTVYGFYFYRNRGITEIEISSTGKLLKKKDENNPPDIKAIPKDVLTLLQKYKGKSKLPIGRLLEISAEALNGTQPNAVAYAAMGDRLVFKTGDLVLDARTGEIISGGKKKKKTP